MTKLENYNDTIFESIKHTDEYGSEYWYARELMVVLEYGQWRNFKKFDRVFSLNNCTFPS